jgi:glutathione S-transferase
MKYLCERFEEIPSHLYPEDDKKKRAKIDQWMFWQHLNVRSASGALMHSSVSKDIAATPSTSGNSVDTNSKDITSSRSLKPSISFKDRKMLARYENEVYNDGGVVESRGGRLVRGDVISLERALGVLNCVLSDDRPFITGDQVTVADLRISFELVQLEAERHLKYVRFGEVKTDMSVERRLPECVERWMGRMSALPKFVDSYNGMMDLHLKLFEAQHNYYVSKSGDVQNVAM